MKIAVSATGKNSNDLLDVRFGRCSYFQIYELESGDIKCIENIGQSSGGGAGIAAAQQVMDENVDVVITGNVGPNAFKIFKSGGIKVLQSGVVSVAEAINDYKDGKLQELMQSGPAHHGMGGR